ncbi:MAG TPA: type II secretion system F family protein, partial [Limnobacter sp.]|nr:type II secretion system F family protein [Limnobacter sp.]
MKHTLSGKQINSKTWQNWLGQWAELLQSGMPVLDALLLSSELQAATRQGTLLQHGLRRTWSFLNEGQGFQTAFRASFGQIPIALEVGLLCAQASGDLPAALKEQIQRWKLTTNASSQLAKSLVYPGLVMLAAFACWILLHHISKPHLPTNASQTGGWDATSSLMMGGGLLLLALSLILKRRNSAGASLFATWLPGCNWASSGYYHLLACELQAGLDLMYCLRHRTIPS